MTDKPRLIGRAFPLKQASLDSVHEKNVRGGEIRTMQVGPARPGWLPWGRGGMSALNGIYAHMPQIHGPKARVAREGVMPCR